MNVEMKNYTPLGVELKEIPISECFLLLEVRQDDLKSTMTTDTLYMRIRSFPHPENIKKSITVMNPNTGYYYCLPLNTKVFPVKTKIVVS